MGNWALKIAGPGRTRRSGNGETVEVLTATFRERLQDFQHRDVAYDLQESDEGWIFCISGVGSHGNDDYAGDIEVLAGNLVTSLRVRKFEMSSAHLTIGDDAPQWLLSEIEEPKSEAEEELEVDDDDDGEKDLEDGLGGESPTVEEVESQKDLEDGLGGEPPTVEEVESQKDL